MQLEQAIKTILDTLITNLQQETFKSHSETFFKLKGIQEANPEQFLEVLQNAQHKFYFLVEACFDVPEQKNQYLVKHIASGLYKHFHLQRIRKLEGFSCSYDKASFIEWMTLKALKEQKNFSLYAEYTNFNQVDEHIDRQAFWSPRTVKDTDEAMKLFWEWYQLGMI